jgi:hypothetical protein
LTGIIDGLLIRRGRTQQVEDKRYVLEGRTPQMGYAMIFYSMFNSVSAILG